MFWNSKMIMMMVVVLGLVLVMIDDYGEYDGDYDEDDGDYDGDKIIIVMARTNMISTKF